MIYYVIRHKATGELMPQAKRDKGYSHWNPSHPEHEFRQKTEVPRLIKLESSAKRIISLWASIPNGKRFGYQTYYGEWDEEIRTVDDGRKKEDLEILEVDLVW